MIKVIYANCQSEGCQSELVEDDVRRSTHKICQCFDKTQHDKFGRRGNPYTQTSLRGGTTKQSQKKHVSPEIASSPLRTTNASLLAMTVLLFFSLLAKVGFSQKDTAFKSPDTTVVEPSTDLIKLSDSLSLSQFYRIQDRDYRSISRVEYRYVQPEPKEVSTYTSTNNFLYHYFDRYEILSGKISPEVFSAVKPFFRVAYTNSRLRKANENWGDERDKYNNRDDANFKYIQNECVDASNRFLDYDKKKILNSFYKYYNSQFFAVQQKDFSMFINPVLSFGVNNENQKSNLFTNTRGIEVRGAISNKIGYYTFLTDNQTYEPTYVNNYINNKKGILDTTTNPGIMPGVGYLKYFKDKKNAYDYFITRGYITFTPVKNVNMMFGHDRNFIGNGIRSLILSDFSPDYLQLKINTKVWRFNYLNIFAELNDYQNTPSGYLPGKKYMAFHHLSMNITKNFNLGLSETVIFARSDSNASRGFDMNYLNPVIFYRSIEQNNNSADNSMIAADWKWNFLHHFSFYGQLVLDEFLLHHLLKQDGYWANKYSIQSGLKYINVFNIKNLDYQFEYNMIRPYTYTHFKTSTAYTNYGQPMAHPLGANLKEQLHILRYQVAPRVYTMFRYMYTQYGADTGGTHWGQNIFVDYHKRQLQRAPNYDLGNEIGQGVKTSIQYFDFTLTYMPWHNLFVELSYIYRNQTSKVPSLNLKSNMIYINLRLNLPKRDMLF